ncbi:hypothetical protein [Rhodococcus sp. NPDC047139]|uniref:hypothetical protein n=1 Tax=Rhodococcus sp. NPDC047139 TaxID=3155141 RepID=UPI003411158C
MARKVRSTSKSRKTSMPEQRTKQVRSNPRTGERSAPSGLGFHEARAPKGAYVADTPSYHYAIKSVASGWELRIYERTNGSGEGQQPGSHELFASHSKTMQSKSACIALAQAFHNLGDSFNEFAHGYRSRFSQALLDVENPAQKTPAATPSRTPTRPPSSAPEVASVVPHTATTQTDTPRPHAPRSVASRTGTRLSATHKQLRSSPPRRLSEAELREAVSIARRQVFVIRGSGVFHASARCRDGRNATHRCMAADAYRSHLSPCPRCSTSLARELGRYIDRTRTGSGAAQPLRLVRIGKKTSPSDTALRRQNQKSRSKGTPGRRTGSRQDGSIPYGAPSNIDDIRFSHRTAAEWGTSSYGQHPEEFLGSPTEDDHDWRGGNSLYE